MFGGHNRVNTSPLFSAFVEDNRLRFGANATEFPRLRLFGDSSVGCSTGHINDMANKNTSPTDQPNHRSQEIDPSLIQQEHLMLLNDYLHQYKVGQPGSILNPNHVSTGLRLSYEDEEHNNSSVTSASENLKAVLPVISSAGNNLKIEIARQNEEFEQYLKLQQEKILKGVTELRQRQTVSFLNAVKNGVSKKLNEKEIELATMNRKNEELMERIEQVTTKVQYWHNKAKYNESVINFLRNNLQQVMAQGAAKEGCGDSELDDAASCTNANHLGLVDVPGSLVFAKKKIHCRACKAKEVSVLLLPCRHLCLCKDCEGFIDICPVCNVLKTASVQVYMS